MTWCFLFDTFSILSLSAEECKKKPAAIRGFFSVYWGKSVPFRWGKKIAHAIWELCELWMALMWVCVQWIHKATLMIFSFSEYGVFHAKIGWLPVWIHSICHINASIRLGIFAFLLQFGFIFGNVRFLMPSNIAMNYS